MKAKVKMGSLFVQDVLMQGNCLAKNQRDSAFKSRDGHCSTNNAGMANLAECA